MLKSRSFSSHQSRQFARLTADLTKYGGPIFFGFLVMANGTASCYGSQLRHASHETFAANALRDRPLDQSNRFGFEQE